MHVFKRILFMIANFVFRELNCKFLHLKKNLLKALFLEAFCWPFKFPIGWTTQLIYCYISNSSIRLLLNVFSIING